jgi:hypothetical protein
MKLALFGSIAQSVELRTHKPSVPSSSLGRATTKNPTFMWGFVYRYVEQIDMSIEYVDFSTFFRQVI